MNKTVIITAGFGRFLGAARRLQLQCSRLNLAYCDFFLIDERALHKIANQNGVEPNIFTAEHRGYGFWQWKPLLIHHYSLKGYDTVIYLDAGCEIDSKSMADFIEWFQEQTDYDLLLSKSGHSIASYTKANVIDALVDSSRLKSQLDSIEMLQAGIVFLKSMAPIGDVFSMATSFVKQRKHFLFNEHIEPMALLPKSFVEHRHDQSVLSLLIIQSECLGRVGVLHSSLTPPDHIDGWAGVPPIIAARNSGGLQMFPLYLKYKSLQEMPFMTRWLALGTSRFTKLLSPC